MSVYNRKTWVHNGRRHWIHNGKHYSKIDRKSYFKKRRGNWKTKVKRKNYSGFFKKFEKELDTYIDNFKNNKKKIKFPKKTLLSQYIEHGFIQRIYLINENGKYYLEDYNERRAHGEEMERQEISYDNALKWYKSKGKLKDLDDDGTYEYFN